MRAPSDHPDDCPNCGALVGEVQVVTERGDSTQVRFERATCPGCALQLVRAPNQPWGGVRG